jgi:hypothetical protein
MFFLNHEQYGPHQKKPGGELMCSPGGELKYRERYAVLASYKTPIVLFMYIVKSGQSLGSDRGNTIYVKS